VEKRDVPGKGGNVGLKGKPAVDERKTEKEDQKTFFLIQLRRSSKGRVPRKGERTQKGAKVIRRQKLG